ncbi:efflux RND transporter periplasmic adaptor subunit [Rhodoblastus acidophilus]|uniref:Efflux RND transporter periplasmic adaptor subunit n=1 Tax=Candidatus Rhodoblastus alkanivorans TaxID=2954117 RepID=A0ABS9Z6A9_9HYPH|nr:efflux RND transporter periplasmic adaptor subunit [Candidatus Rhodoblastus alkanivorans]MCI4679131.1 efflux RND transporter periplasmic adaptor subunit [Candidatus Rhodoblastus alkanivorans]MCI4683127.1 efflux RND transporter periplasmic adaptor subunit [Candidatus Rhodoblastus alkanivorans]MDI4640438.1 efflux RND transporter periplasmic adaptor subunit [Rhodoblastus acidophilus]
MKDVFRFSARRGLAPLWLAAALALFAAAAAPAAQAQAQSAPPQIPVMLPKMQTVSDTLEIVGNAAAINQVKLVARVPGYLEQIHFEDGAIVKKGDLLFTVQQDQYKAQLQQAQAQLEAQVVARDHAKLEVGRYTALLAKHATSQVEVDHWVFQEKTAEANIKAAQAQVAIAQLNLSYTEVRAPFDGQMGKHLIDAGNMVGASAQTAVLAEITQLNPIYVVANISSQQALQIRANLDQRRLTLAELHKVPIEAQLSDEKGFPHKGTVEYVAPAIDPTTGTLYVRGVLPNPTRTFLPGMFVKIRLPMGKIEKSALLVPQTALQEDQGGRYLLIVNDGNVVEKRYVQLGQTVGAMQTISDGLNRTDRIVVGELWRVSAGMTVTPKLTTAAQ